MDPVKDIKDDIPFLIMHEFMNYNFYNQQIQESIVHKTKFIQRGKKFLSCINV